VLCPPKCTGTPRALFLPCSKTLHRTRSAAGCHVDRIRAGHVTRLATHGRSMSENLKEVGTGTNLFPAGVVRGTARWFHETADVLSVDEDEVEQTIAFVQRAG